jgi:hypothetical protein
MAPHPRGKSETPGSLRVIELTQALALNVFSPAALWSLLYLLIFCLLIKMYLPIYDSLMICNLISFQTDFDIIPKRMIPSQSAMPRLLGHGTTNHENRT